MRNNNNNNNNDADAKKSKKTVSKIVKLVEIVLFIAMLVLIFTVSPRITKVIRDAAKYIYEIDSTYITRIIELVLSTTFVMSIALSNKNK